MLPKKWCTMGKEYNAHQSLYLNTWLIDNPRPGWSGTVMLW